MFSPNLKQRDNKHIGRANNKLALPMATCDIFYFDL